MAHPRPITFQSLVLSWYDQHGRKHLPWQQNRNAYRVWLSEIMLQQTQVTTVIPYFQCFVNRFPNVHTLAQATTDEVLHLWTGLGYYSRARNLHKAAKIIVSTFHGKFPDNLNDLQKLPGVGRSTAGAILTQAFNQPAPILDGNVKRVLTRFYAIEGYPGNSTIEKQLWSLAEALIPSKRVTDYTQAMMDLGAMICTRTQPHCHQCPLAKHCLAKQRGLENVLPHKKPTKALPTRHTQFILMQNEHNEILLEKRPPTGIWGGLWSPPDISENDIETICKSYACDYISKQGLPAFRHTFSHFHLTIEPWLVKVKTNGCHLMAPEQQLWYNLAEPASIGLPQPIKKLLKTVYNSLLETKNLSTIK